MITPKKVLDIFQENQALLKGHFLLSSGLHSEKYLQCAQVLQYPKFTKLLGKELAEKFKAMRTDTVVSPALGGIVIGHEVAKTLGCRFIFTERQEGKMILRRGFTLKTEERVLIIEDVFTTGGSTKEVMEVASQLGALVIGVGAIIHRGAKEIDFGVPEKYLLKLNIKTYEPAKCPLCKEGLPVCKPGSRTQKK